MKKQLVFIKNSKGGNFGIVTNIEKGIAQGVYKFSEDGTPYSYDVPFAATINNILDAKEVASNRKNEINKALKHLNHILNICQDITYEL